jgi:hypothetical protein
MPKAEDLIARWKIQSNWFFFAPEQRANPSDTVSIKEVVGVSDRKCMQRTAGGAEVPLGEMRYLKVTDIDSQRVVIRIREAKVAKTATSCSARSSSML